MERESFQSRLGFILMSAGCAIGIGNVWKFPYVTGNSGGGAFVLMYLIFLVMIGVPIMTMEFSVGRASRKSCAQSFKSLEKPGQKWHWSGWLGLAGNYLLMMFYTTVAGWMLYYFYLFFIGRFDGLDTAGVQEQFNTMLSQPGTMAFWMLLVVLIGFAACSLGLQKGVERLTKWMMLSLLVLIVGLGVYSLTLPGAVDGLKFYLLPDWGKVCEIGVLNVAVSAMNQAFFTLSIGIGSMAIFGSYLGKDETLLGESLRIAGLDTFVAIMAGLIIFPACFSFGIQPDAGPPLVFITLPNVFNSMQGGRVIGGLFFLFMSFAALSTVLAVFENIMACCMDLWHWDRKKTAIINLFVVGLGSLPCVLGCNVWSAFQPFGAGSAVLDLEDFLVSNLALPFGSLVYLMFCVSRWGWGFENYMEEANTGRGVKMQRWMRNWLTYILPVVVLFLLLQGIWSKFAG